MWFTVSNIPANVSYLLYDSTSPTSGFTYTGGYCYASSGTTSCPIGPQGQPGGTATWYFEVVGGGITSNVVEVTWG